MKKLWRCIFCWDIPEANESEVSEADAIVTQAFSYLRDGSPGPVNQILANIVRDLHKRWPEKPIIPQEGVAFVAPEINYFDIVRMPEGESIKRSSSSWNTESVARFQSKICKKHGWNKVVFIAACPCHQGRTFWVMEKLGLKPICVKMPKNNYFHSDSAYWATRAGWRMLIREFLCRIYFLLSGRI